MSKQFKLGIVLSALTVTAWAQTNTPHFLTAVPLQQVVIEDDFWSPKLKVWREVTVPDSWTKFENDRGGAINNFDRVRDGKSGNHAGPEWYDGLIYEMIRGSADFLATHPDPALQTRIEGYIDRIAAAAGKDPHGYIETWTQLQAPDHRWGLNGGNDVEQHELYNAGALVEAGIHWYRTTGQIKLLQVAVRMANNMADLMGPPPKVNQVPGHSLGEEALAKLYLLFKEHPELKLKMTVPVDENAYLKLAEFWIDNRGNHEGRARNWGAYAQDDVPLAQQQAAEGHAVRAGLFYTGITAVGKVSGREDYLGAASRLWDNMQNRKIYVTGGLGAGLGIEGFGDNYYLPNNTAYAETCASVAGGFFDLNMGLTFADAKYADALEREMFNGALAGVSLNGDRYYYENPLETDSPHQRWSWHGCPCCPPMFLKFMGALPGYIYALDTNAVYVNQFIGNQTELTVGGAPVSLHLKTGYPWDGNISLSVDPEKAAEFDVYLRIPSWCQGISSSNDLYQIVGRPVAGAVTIKINGKPVGKLDMIRGYARLHRQWKSGDQIELVLDMPVRQVRANPKVEADRDMVALMRGPVVYCAETADNPAGWRQMIVGPEATFETEFKPGLLGGVAVLEGKVYTLDSDGGKVKKNPAKLVAVPFYANDNREPSSLRVWLPANTNKAVIGTLSMRSRASASYCWHEDSVAAINDGFVPVKSSDNQHSRLSWWDHKGTQEWAQLDFPKSVEVSKASVYWFADRAARGGCDAPQSWKLFYKDGDDWKPVGNPSSYGVALDQFNEISFSKVKTTALRVEVQAQEDWSAGIYEFKVE